MFNQDALFRSYERRTKSIPRQIDESKDAVDEFDPLSYGHGAKPSPVWLPSVYAKRHLTMRCNS